MSKAANEVYAILFILFMKSASAVFYSFCTKLVRNVLCFCNKITISI